MQAFFSVRSLKSPYFQVKIQVKNGVAFLMADNCRIATFNGAILGVLGHLPEVGYVSDVFDAILREGCQLFSGRQGIKAVEQLNARWAEDWFTLCYDPPIVCPEIAYPFRMDIVNLRVHIPDSFFFQFVQDPSSDILKYRQRASYRILMELKDLIHIPAKFRKAVLRRTLEMRLEG